MTKQDSSITAAACPGKERIITVIHLKQLFSGMQSQICKGQETQRESWENQVVDALTQCNGFSWDTHRYCHPKRKPFQDRGKESQKHQANPESRD